MLWVLVGGLVIFIAWIAIDMLIEKVFDNSDLGDSDYGC